MTAIHSIRSATITILVALSVAASLVLAGATVADAQKCEAGKMKAAGKLADSTAKAVASYIAKPSPDSLGSSLVKASAKFHTTMLKLEAKNICLATGDAAAIEEKVDGAIGCTGDSQGVPELTEGCNCSFTCGSRTFTGFGLGYLECKRAVLKGCGGVASTFSCSPASSTGGCDCTITCSDMTTPVDGVHVDGVAQCAEDAWAVCVNPLTVTCPPAM